MIKSIKERCKMNIVIEFLKDKIEELKSDIIFLKRYKREKTRLIDTKIIINELKGKKEEIKHIECAIKILKDNGKICI
jgi:hypothetical protein